MRRHDSPEPGAAANARSGRAYRDAELAPVAAPAPTYYSSRVSFVETKFPPQAECYSMTGAFGPGGLPHRIAHPQR
jgi:hypothetical protein